MTFLSDKCLFVVGIFTLFVCQTIKRNSFVIYDNLSLDLLIKHLFFLIFKFERKRRYSEKWPSKDNEDQIYILHTFHHTTLLN